MLNREVELAAGRRRWRIDWFWVSTSKYEGIEWLMSCGADRETIAPYKPVEVRVRHFLVGSGPGSGWSRSREWGRQCFPIVKRRR